MLEWRVTVDTIGVKWPKQNTSSANQEGIQQIPSREMSGTRTIVPILWASERAREIGLRRTALSLERPVESRNLPVEPKG